jgi:copper(I)-binding protein
MRHLLGAGLVVAAACVLHPAIAADARPGAITISAAWSRATFGPGATGIAFMRIANAGAADALVGASCDGAQTTSLHTENSGTMAMPGMAPMRTDSMPVLDRIPIPPHGQVVLKPGGLHIMLQNMSMALTVGQSVPCVLHFQNAGTLPVTLKVGRAGASRPPK